MAVDIAKDYVNEIENKWIYATITAIQIYNVIDNNVISKKYGLDEIWNISYSWEF